MTVHPYWVQRVDYTSVDDGPVDATTATELVRSHDWAAELTYQQEREAAGLESCPPGIGFVAGHERILHICPCSDGTALLHFHTSEPRALSGIPMMVSLFLLTLVAGVVAFGSFGGLVTSSTALIGVLAAILAAITFQRAITLVRRPARVYQDPVTRTTNPVAMSDVSEYVRRFYEQDDSWLKERMFIG